MDIINPHTIIVTGAEVWVPNKAIKIYPGIARDVGIAIARAHSKDPHPVGKPVVYSVDGKYYVAYTTKTMYVVRETINNG